MTGARGVARYRGVAGSRPAAGQEQDNTCHTGHGHSEDDADGNLLLQKDPGQSTLYLFGDTQEITDTGGTVSGTRFIALPGGGQVVRTGAGGSYSFEFSDQHATSLLILNNNLATPAWRQFTPYGAARGTAPSAWPDAHGFVGKPTDANTGLTIIGARAYDPANGRFTSVDPVLDPSDPQTLNGYAYAGDDPVSQWDPTGLSLPGGGGGHDPCGVDQQNCHGGSPGGSGGGGYGGGGYGGGGTGAGSQIAQAIADQGHPVELQEAFTNELASVEHGFAPHVQAWQQWQALYQACADHPWLCSPALLGTALHTSATEQYDYQLATAAMYRRTAAHGWNAALAMINAFGLAGAIDPAELALTEPASQAILAAVITRHS